jgi:hypothetical protein
VNACRQRNLLFFTTPNLWPNWPVLPLVRRREGQEEELGLLVDAMGLADRPGYSATVFKTNIFLLPPTLEELLQLPREAFDTAEELFEAGWAVD